MSWWTTILLSLGLSNEDIPNDIPNEKGEPTEEDKKVILQKFSTFVGLLINNIDKIKVFKNDDASINTYLKEYLKITNFANFTKKDIDKKDDYTNKIKLLLSHYIQNTFFSCLKNKNIVTAYIVQAKNQILALNNMEGNKYQNITDTTPILIHVINTSTPYIWSITSILCKQSQEKSSLDYYKIYYAGIQNKLTSSEVIKNLLANKPCDDLLNEYSQENFEKVNICK